MDKYEIVGEIGQDAYGEVYKARHRKTNETMALKKIQLEQEDEGVLFKVNQEIAVLKILIHENIVRLWDAKRIEKSFYLYYEYLDLDLKKHKDSSPDFAKDHRQIKILDWPAHLEFLSGPLQMRGDTMVQSSRNIAWISKDFYPSGCLVCGLYICRDGKPETIIYWGFCD